ncbi:MAG: hypothetical protein ACKO1W_04900 [Microcystaceae cyanobacterium]
MPDAPNTTESPLTQIQEGKSALNAFLEAVDKAVNLEIVTIIEETTDAIDRSKPLNQQGKPGQTLYTRINLIDGDIVNVFGQDFIANEQNSSLVEFHKSQVSKGEEIIQTNLETLKKIIDYALQLKKSEKSATPTS